MQSKNKLMSFILAMTAAMAAGQAIAGGTVNGVTASKPNLDLGQSLSANVAGTINKDQFNKGCQVKISLKYADNSVEVAHPGFLVSAFPANDFYLKPTKAGAVQIIAEGGGNNNLGWPHCQGKAQTLINVAAPIVVSANPNLKLRPEAGSMPQVDVSRVPAGSLQLPKLASMKQVPYTNHSGETWVEVGGSGNCSFTIEGAGLAPQSFASSAAKPFPMKVKIAGAPLGSHTWKAKGTGNCTGEATATFSVD